MKNALAVITFVGLLLLTLNTYYKIKSKNKLDFLITAQQQNKWNTIMPKYYVSFLDNNNVVEAKNPLDACVKVIKKTSVITAGITWKVSEIGFADHAEDILINDLKILKYYKHHKDWNEKTWTKKLQ